MCDDGESSSSKQKNKGKIQYIHYILDTGILEAEAGGSESFQFTIQS